jgi:hypothetical protein
MPAVAKKKKKQFKKKKNAQAAAALAAMFGGGGGGYAPNPRRPWERSTHASTKAAFLAPVSFVLRMSYCADGVESAAGTQYVDASDVGPSHTVGFIKSWAASQLGISPMDIAFSVEGRGVCSEEQTMAQLGINGTRAATLVPLRRAPPALPATPPPRKKIAPPVPSSRPTPKAEAPLMPISQVPPPSNLFAQRAVELYRALNVRGDGVLAFGEASALYSRAEWDDVRSQARPAAADGALAESLGIADWTNWLMRLRTLYSESEVMYDLLDALRTLSGASRPRVSPTAADKRRLDAQLRHRQPVWCAAEDRAFAEHRGWRPRLRAMKVAEEAHARAQIAARQTRVRPRLRRQLLALGRERLASLVDAQLQGQAIPYARWFAFMRLVDAGSEPLREEALNAVGLCEELDGTDQRELFAIFDVDADGVLSPDEVHLALHALWYYARAASDPCGEVPTAKPSEAESDSDFARLVAMLFATHLAPGEEVRAGLAELARCALYLLSVESAVQRGEVKSQLAVRAAIAAKMCLVEQARAVGGGGGTVAESVGASEFAAYASRTARLRRDGYAAEQRVAHGGSPEYLRAQAAAAEAQRARASLERALDVLKRDVALLAPPPPPTAAELAAAAAAAEAEATEANGRRYLALPAPPASSPPPPPPDSAPPCGTPRGSSSSYSYSSSKVGGSGRLQYATEVSALVVAAPSSAAKARRTRSRGKKFMAGLYEEGEKVERAWRKF